MAKTSKIAMNDQRAVLVDRYRQRRSALRQASKDISLTLQDRMAASAALAKLPRNSAAVRIRNRDHIDGRPRGYVRKVGLSRIAFRAAAHRGELPGITTSSW